MLEVIDTRAQLTYTEWQHDSTDGLSHKETDGLSHKEMDDGSSRRL